MCFRLLKGYTQSRNQLNSQYKKLDAVVVVAKLSITFRYFELQNR